MNKKKYGFVACLLAVITIVCIGATNIYVNYERDSIKKEEKLRIVTSFYPMYIAALNVVDGCDSVILENLSEPQTGCLHDYQLTPEDMIRISNADVFIVNGGGIESFLEEIASAYPDLLIIEAAQGIEKEDDNAHVWMDTGYYQKEVENIAKGLAQFMEEREADRLLENAKQYCGRIKELADIGPDPERLRGQNVVLFHEAFVYMANELGMEVSYLLNLDEERQVSAGEAADVVRAVGEENTGVILAERLYGEELAERIHKETGAKVIYLDTCVRGDYEKNAYLDAMKKNLEALSRELP